MVNIIGDGQIPEAKAFYDVKASLHFDQDVYLAAMLAPLFKVKLTGQIIYNVEPLYDGCRSFSVGYLDTLKQNIILDYSKNNVDYLKNHGIEAFHMPYGYHQTLTRAPVLEKDIDVLFVGSINERRIRILRELKKDLRFVWAQGFYGKDLDNLIARAKVHVNVHYCDDHPLEVVRLNYLMANHCTVVSERGNDPEQNAQYEKGLIFTDDVVSACYEALDTPLDGFDVIRNMPHSCITAQEWIYEH